MNIIITGATGFIGSHLVQHFLEKEMAVTAFTTNARNARSVLPDTIHILEWSAPESDLIQAIDKADAIINLAGAGIISRAWTPSYKEILLKSRVKTTERLTALIHRSTSKPAVMVQGSATGFYGNDPEKTFTEQSGQGIGFLPELTHKWESASLPVTKDNVRLVIIRTGVVIASEGGFIDRLKIPFRWFIGGPVGNGNQWFSWIDLRDETGAIDFLLKTRNARGVFNLTAPQPLRQKDFFALFGQAVHRPSWLPVPACALKMALGQRAKEVILSSQKVLPVKLLKAGYAFRFPDAKSSLQNWFSENR